MSRKRDRFHPRTWWDALWTYPRYLGALKPELLAGSHEEFRARMASLERGWWPKKLSVPAGKRILALSAHPDDEALGAGGFLLAHRGLAQIHLVTVCDGLGGGSAAERKKELGRAAEVLQVSSTQALDFPDGAVPLTMESAEKLKKIVEKIQPDLVLLPWFLEDQSDHRAANLLYAWGCDQLRCAVLGYEIWTLLQPNAVLDITDRIEEKEALIRLYPSQIKKIRYLDYAMSLARVRAFHHLKREDRGGAAEGFLALPNREYCDLVRGIYGPPGALKESAKGLLH